MNKVKQRAKKGTISVRKRKGGYEARITLDIEGVENLRITRCSSISERDARQRLGEAVAEAYMKYGRRRGYTEEYVEQQCSEQMQKISDFKNNERRKEAMQVANKVTLFKNVARSWLDFKKKQTQLNNSKKLGEKTFNTYVYITTKNLMPVFSDYDVNRITKEVFQEHIDTLKGHKKAKDECLVMKLIMDYALKKNWAKRNPIQNIVLPTKKKHEISYISTEEQSKWIDCMEKDSREWALLFATLLQTGMRPEERLRIKVEIC